MSVFSLIDCAEEYTSDEKFDILTGEISMSTQLRCAYSDRHALVDDILTNLRAHPKASDLIYPPRAVNATIVSVKGNYASVGQTMLPEEALVTVNYSTRAPELISEELEPTAEFLKQDHRNFKWADNGDPLLENEAPGRLVRGMNLTRTLFKVTPPLPITLLTLPGCCNAGAYASNLLGLTFASETLLFGQPKLSRSIKMNGTGYEFKLAMRFTYKAQGWNMFWRAKTQTYTRMLTSAGAPYFNHPLGDFSAYLF